MLNLPKSTKYGKKIPKTKFYQNLNLPNKVKQQFVDEIETIIWQNKISPDTISISPGEEVTEIEVIEIRLHQKGISKNILEIIDRGIPYHIIFVLTFKVMAQIGIGYKEKIKKKDDKYRVERYYFSEWASSDGLTIELNGLNLDRIYENLLRQYIPEERPQLKDLKDTIALQKEIEKQNAFCDALEKKMKSEKQFNVQVILNHELKEARRKLENMTSENTPDGKN
ncbi:MAG: DUF4391 domain-containing protein [Acidobacteria bacterium]|nr:DUF4391 domain-containing protein [Acidobacteriota bacterium]